MFILGPLVETIFVRRIKASGKLHMMDNSNKHMPRQHTAATGT